jgi:hypothetical protein
LPADIVLPDMLAAREHPFGKPGPGMPQRAPFPNMECIQAVITRITECAAGAPGPKTAGHGDWASGNMRFSDGEVSSIFDFEALVQGPEPLLVGQAAIQFVNEPHGVRDPAVSTVEFIKAYESATRRIFNGDEAVSLDTGIALAVSTFCRRLVRTRGLRDTAAPRVFSEFMSRFRAALGREYSARSWI